MGRYKTGWSCEMKQDLVAYIKLLETKLFGFQCKEFLELAYKVAEVNKIPK